MMRIITCNNLWKLSKFVSYIVVIISLILQFDIIGRSFVLTLIAHIFIFHASIHLAAHLNNFTDPIVVRDRLKTK